MNQERGKKEKGKEISSWRFLFRSYTKRQSRTPKLKGITRRAVMAIKRCTKYKMFSVFWGERKRRDNVWNNILKCA